VKLEKDQAFKLSLVALLVSHKKSNVLLLKLLFALPNFQTVRKAKNLSESMEDAAQAANNLLLLAILHVAITNSVLPKGILRKVFAEIGFLS
jgi:hypothetical protein